MAIKDWNGFKKSGDTYIPNDATARAGVTATVDLLKDTAGWLGGNLNPLTLDNLKTWNTNGAWNNNVYTNSGITYTVNTDSKGNVLSIVSNGTNSSSSQKAFCVGIVTLSAGDYTVSGLVTDGGYTSYWINVYNVTDSANIKDVKSANEHIDFTLLAEKNIRLNYFVAGDATVSNISLYPMILTSEQYALNPSYRPYHESVAEMLDGKADDMCSAGNHTLYMIATAITPSNGQPEFFIPWSNPKKKNITLGNNFEVYMRKNSSWTKLTWSANPVITRAENGFYVGLTLDEALTPEEVFGFRVQGDIVFS